MTNCDELIVKVRGSRLILGWGTPTINKKIEGFLIGKGFKNGAQGPVHSVNFESNSGNRSASRGGIGVFPSPFQYLTFNVERPAVLV